MFTGFPCKMLAILGDWTGKHVAGMLNEPPEAWNGQVHVLLCMTLCVILFQIISSVLLLNSLRLAPPEWILFAFILLFPGLSDLYLYLLSVTFALLSTLRGSYLDTHTFTHGHTHTHTHTVMYTQTHMYMYTLLSIEPDSSLQWAAMTQSVVDGAQ